VVKFHDPKSLSLTITDTRNYTIYEVHNHKLVNILTDTVKAALERTNAKNLNVKIITTTPGSDESMLTVSIRVTYDFIPEIEETIHVP